MTSPFQLAGAEFQEKKGAEVKGLPSPRLSFTVPFTDLEAALVLPNLLRSFISMTLFIYFFTH